MPSRKVKNGFIRFAFCFVGGWAMKQWPAPWCNLDRPLTFSDIEGISRHLLASSRRSASPLARPSAAR